MKPITEVAWTRDGTQAWTDEAPSGTTPRFCCDCDDEAVAQHVVNLHNSNLTRRTISAALTEEGGPK